MPWNDECGDVPKKVWDIIDTKPTLAEQLKEQNDKVDGWIKSGELKTTDVGFYAEGVRENKIIIGVDKGSSDGDFTIAYFRENDKTTIIGESVELFIPIGWNTKTVKAIRVGDLAIHDDIDDANCWQVTHVPTLTRFDNAVPDGDFTQEQLCMWCWKIQQEFSTNFEQLRAYNNSNYKEIRKDILEGTKIACLSIGVE